MSTLAWIIIGSFVVFVISGVISFGRMDVGPDWLVVTCFALQWIAAIVGIACLIFLLGMAVNLQITTGAS
ncbi:hypothetical protein SEA_SKOG_56 [Gordonia phage Skog]|uniref:Uncharacterized protein n=1 Tax=Gordonia phage Skog TaxID=2704033 RepID=A0A6G6XJD8_9CAUD|nr:hypothetical protein KHQ85_gp056 [Gordonia phage Skog]QIG58208.1 hypothetical protein SEA_SKOG_56 [Gordonia phage Skog]